MEMSGERTINASRAVVWAALNDPEVLKASIPGCEEMEKTSDTEFVATVVQKVGPVKAKFTGEVELSDIVEGESYRITGRGKGGAAGGATGGAAVTLEDADGGTLLKYEAEAKVTGKIAQLGSRLIAGFAKKMADEFFDRFKVRVEGGEPEDTGAGTAAAAAAAAGAEEASRGVANDMAEAVDTAQDMVEAEAESAREAVDEAEAASRGVANDMAEAVDTAHEAVESEADAARKSTAESFDEFSEKVDEETRGIARDAGAFTDRVTGAIGETAEELYEGARERLTGSRHEDDGKADDRAKDDGQAGETEEHSSFDDIEKASKDLSRNLAGPVDRATEAIEDAAREVRKAIEDSPPAKKSFWKRLFGR